MRNNPPVRLRTERKHSEREGKIWRLTAQTVYHIQATGTHLSPWDIIYVYTLHWCSLFLLFRAAGAETSCYPQLACSLACGESQLLLKFSDVLRLKTLVVGKIDELDLRVKIQLNDPSAVRG